MNIKYMEVFVNSQIYIFFFDDWFIVGNYEIKVL